MATIYFLLFAATAAVFYKSVRRLALLRENNDTKIFLCLFTSFVSQIASYLFFAMFVAKLMCK